MTYCAALETYIWPHGQDGTNIGRACGAFGVGCCWEEEGAGEKKQIWSWRWDKRKVREIISPYVEIFDHRTLVKVLSLSQIGLA